MLVPSRFPDASSSSSGGAPPLPDRFEPPVPPISPRGERLLGAMPSVELHPGLAESTHTMDRIAPTKAAARCENFDIVVPPGVRRVHAVATHETR